MAASVVACCGAATVLEFANHVLDFEALLAERLAFMGRAVHSSYWPEYR